MTRRALVFMANDRYLDWVKAFLESVRSKDPDLPLYCIPHGGPMEGVCNLRGVFGFELLSDGLERLDALDIRSRPVNEAHPPIAYTLLSELRVLYNRVIPIARDGQSFETVKVAVSCTQVHGTAFIFWIARAGESTYIDRRGLPT